MNISIDKNILSVVNKNVKINIDLCCSTYSDKFIDKKGLCH